MNRKLLLLMLLSTMALSINAQVVATNSVAMNRASNPNQVIGESLKTTGTVSLAIGVPCLAAGIAGVLYANLLPNPVAGYTTSKIQAQTDGSTYIPTNEYNARVKDFNNKTHIAEMAGYIMTPLGGALMIVGIPLYATGNKMLKLNMQVSSNGAGVVVNF